MRREAWRCRVGMVTGLSALLTFFFFLACFHVCPGEGGRGGGPNHLNKSSLHPHRFCYYYHNHRLLLHILL